MFITEVIKKSDLSTELQELCDKYGVETFIRKSFVHVKEPEFKEGERAEITYISTRDIDRDGEILLPSGCDLKEFKKAPQVFWGHRTTEPPIGSDQWIKTDNIGIIAKTIYAETPRAEEIWQLVKQKHLKTSSVGFLPIKWVNNNEEGWAKLVERLHKSGYIFDQEKVKRIYTKWILLEHSKVGVAANPNALTVQVAKGLLHISPETLEALGIDSLETKGVIAYHDYGTASEGAAWDAGREVRAADVETLKKICAWYDSENAENKGAYKLPHHQASGLKAVWRGVAAAMAALLGARGGVQIPGADRKAVYNHLAKHYDQFDKEPPEFKEYSELEAKGLFVEYWKDIEDGLIDLEWLFVCLENGWDWEEHLFGLKPYPNEHSCRLEDPDKYNRFARNNNRFGDGIHAIFGRRKTDGKSELQAIHSDKSKFTVAQAKKWCKDHDHTCKPFEPATEQSRSTIVCSICDPEPATFIQIIDEPKSFEEKIGDETVKALNRALGKV